MTICFLHLCSISKRRLIDDFYSVILHYTHSFNGLFSRTTWVSRYQEGKTSLDLNDARDNGVLGWQWCQMDRMQTIHLAADRQPHQHLITQFLQARCSSWHPTNIIKALKAVQSTEGTIALRESRRTMHVTWVHAFGRGLTALVRVWL